MKRIRGVGLVAVTALALIATTGVASAAPSTLGTTGKYPATLAGAGTESFSHQIQTQFLGTLKCNAPALTATLGAASTSLLVSPSNASCGIATWKMNECKLTYHFGPELPNGNFIGTFDIGPPGCAPMEIIVTGCTTKIGAQKDLAALYRNVGSGASAAIEAEANAASNLRYSQSGACGKTGEFTTGGWQGAWLIQNTGGDLTLEDNNSGFVAEDYPATITGGQKAEDKHTFNFDVAQFQCGTATFAGGEWLENQSAVTMTPTYSECTHNGTKGSTVETNGCAFVTGLSTVDITCPGGKFIKITNLFGSICERRVYAQTGLKGIQQSPFTTGGGVFGIAFDWDGVTGVAYEKIDTFGCPWTVSVEKRTDGSFGGTTTLEGTSAGQPTGIWYSPPS